MTCCLYTLTHNSDTKLYRNVGLIFNHTGDTGVVMCALLATDDTRELQLVVINNYANMSLWWQRMEDVFRVFY